MKQLTIVGELNIEEVTEGYVFAVVADEDLNLVLRAFDGEKVRVVVTTEED